MNFDGVASFYDQLASIIFLGRIKKSQLSILNKIPPTGSVLIIGGGTGWITKRVIDSPEVEHITYIESSNKMLDSALKKCPVIARDRVEFIHGDENSIPDRIYDGVITNFILDCFDIKRLHLVIDKLSYHLKKGGKWYLADFRKNDRVLWQRKMLELMYFFFQNAANIEATQLYNYPKILEKRGYKKISSLKFYFGFIQSGVWIK
ncbi:MAG: methyltransferase domain-containing protein [Cyclobacteriaceae bacterium]